VSELEPAAASGVILVAEDHPQVRALLELCLGLAGHRVIAAADGLAALALAVPEVDLLVTDVEMPRVGGHELAARLALELPWVEVLFVSGALPPAGTDAEHFLPKPFGRVELLDRVTPLLVRAAARRARSPGGPA
jgi:CheY-like chemotaxis protein